MSAFPMNCLQKSLTQWNTDPLKDNHRLLKKWIYSLFPHGFCLSPALRWSSSQQTLQSCSYHHCAPQARAQLTPVCSQKANLLHFTFSCSQALHLTPTPITARGLDGRATSSCPQIAALGREGSSPRWISAVPWVFYGLLLIYSQFSILVNGYKLDWSHKS